MNDAPRIPGGRRTKLTPDTQKRIIDAVRAGATYQAAAGAAGVAERTFYQWLQKAEQPGADPALVQFAHDLNRARNEVEVRLVAGSVMKAAMGGAVVRETTRTLRDGTQETVRDYAPPDGRLGLDVLARQFRERGWARERLEVTGADGGPIQVQHAVINQLAEQLQAELEACRPSVVVEAVEVEGDG
ncbi:helix-turn-helix domain-containing protein [Streptosporangium sp. NPDC051023]|uniref:helix-turn-helix domain-containing protein n=1 Tax=Streptosporangium sp. NPDC051023 TaxID=3155410 RepID=UPI00344E8B35